MKTNMKMMKKFIVFILAIVMILPFTMQNNVRAASASDTVSVSGSKWNGYTVGIDAGHQKYGNYGVEPVGPGASVKKTKVTGGTSGSYSKVPEYKLTLKVAKKLKKELESRGYKVVMTRTKNNVNISNKQRALKLNKECDIAIRLHADGVTSSSVSGASALYPTLKNPYLSDKISKKSKKLSNCILKAYCKKTGIIKRGLSGRDDLTGTNWSTIPVTLIELGFMTNRSDDLYMSSKDGIKAMVKGLANGVDKYFGL